MRQQWAYRRVNPELYLAFSLPPENIIQQHSITVINRVKWREMEHIDGIYTRNLVAELLRKTLEVVCHNKGLVYCQAQRITYFPWHLLRNNRLTYTRLNRQATWLSAAGERTFRSGASTERYRYFLAPEFYVRRNLGAEYTVLVRIRLRLSDASGEPLPSRKITSRRRHAGKDWWNGEWLDRLIAVCQYLSDGERISCGTGSSRIVFDARPLILRAPMGINERALPGLSYIRPDVILEEDDMETYDESDAIEIETDDELYPDSV